MRPKEHIYALQGENVSSFRKDLVTSVSSIETVESA